MTPEPTQPRALRLLDQVHDALRVGHCAALSRPGGIRHFFRGLALGLACLLPWPAVAADGKPSLLIYQTPQEYTHEVRIGMMPYFSRWVLRGPATAEAAQQALAPLFSDIALCDGKGGAEVLVWLRPVINYNPVSGNFHARVTARFYLGSGSLLATVKGTGDQSGEIRSIHAEMLVRQAFGAAMQDVARQYAEHDGMRRAVAIARMRDMTLAPCGIIGAVPNP